MQSILIMKKYPLLLLLLALFACNDDESAMDPTGSGGFHPAHLHYGTFDNPDAEMAAMLNPVDATTGESSTTIYKLLDETKVTYMDLVEFDGSIKIHLDDGPNKKVVIAAANIGLNASADISGGLLQ